MHTDDDVQRAMDSVIREGPNVSRERQMGTSWDDTFERQVLLRRVEREQQTVHGRLSLG